LFEHRTITGRDSRDDAAFMENMGMTSAMIAIADQPAHPTNRSALPPRA
jgi:hypothetical protein